jgi:hypothetical protein
MTSTGSISNGTAQYSLNMDTTAAAQDSRQQKIEGVRQYSLNMDTTAAAKGHQTTDMGQTGITAVSWADAIRQQRRDGPDSRQTCELSACTALYSDSGQAAT